MGHAHTVHARTRLYNTGHAHTVHVAMKNFTPIVCVFFLYLVFARCQKQDAKQESEGQGKREPGKMDLSHLKKIRDALGNGGDDLEYKRYLKELITNNPG